MSKNFIIQCDDSVQNEKVQIKILAKGYTWVTGYDLIKHTNEPVLIFDNLNSRVRTISYHSKIMSDDYKKNSCYKNYIRISASDFLKNVNLRYANQKKESHKEVINKGE